MYHNPTPYIPKTKAEVWDMLGRMMLGSPTFVDTTGYFPHRNIDTEFFALNEGFKAIRKQLGEESYQTLVRLSAQMRSHFEDDPDDRTGEARKGRECIHEMEDILRAGSRRKR